ncbi:Putative zinc-or iron-chelating domain-containing protein [Solimonas aquatica]|uniref:Putative zinc-or iron-chelating domain-containing protein n=1 Tax=Solimonas aquatica TaxID=489703 RepID=A0A1H9IMJ0_9GAMM|nr:YkgJ family cysteine cluster protein [Solimonas aquatica]SEQ75804.1 Putative zinc-or iron-chelating domain-containing protein [Solimonas aquatica]
MTDTALDARGFYQMLQQAFARQLRGPRGPALPGALLNLGFESFTRNVEAQCEDEPPLACDRGCAACCSLRVAASAPEVLLAAQFLRAVQPGLRQRGIDLLGRLREVEAKVRGLSEPQRVALRQGCAFVVQGVCVIYAVRPLACRGHASHDARACAQAAAGRVEQVPYSVGHQRLRSLVQNALQAALREAGLAWGLYEFHQALRIALEHEDALCAWLAGEEVLLAAKLPELPEAELAQAYDALQGARN